MLAEESQRRRCRSLLNDHTWIWPVLDTLKIFTTYHNTHSILCSTVHTYNPGVLPCMQCNVLIRMSQAP
jgi:hypothetical protein